MKINRLILLVFATIAFSCGSDGGENGPGYEFIDQDAAGEIENEPWAYADGYASINDDMISIDLVLPQDEEGCDMGIPEGSSVFFNVPNAVDLYKLKFNLSNPVGNQTVTLYLEDGLNSVNYVATEGAIEILEITGSTVSGRIDARYDKNTYVNGNFTISICPI
jgi:hypothetical protein